MEKRAFYQESTCYDHTLFWPLLHFFPVFFDIFRHFFHIHIARKRCPRPPGRASLRLFLKVCCLKMRARAHTFKSSFFFKKSNFFQHFLACAFFNFLLTFDTVFRFSFRFGRHFSRFLLDLLRLSWWLFSLLAPFRNHRFADFFLFFRRFCANSGRPGGTIFVVFFAYFCRFYTPIIFSKFAFLYSGHTLATQ